MAANKENRILLEELGAILPHALFARLLGRVRKGKIPSRLE